MTAGAEHGRREKHDRTKSTQFILTLFVCFIMRQLYLWLKLRRQKLNHIYVHLDKSPHKMLGGLPTRDERHSDSTVGYAVVEFVIGEGGDGGEGVRGGGGTWPPALLPRKLQGLCSW